MRLKAALLIFFVVIITYSNSLGGEFVYDDQYFIVKNINIRNLENIPSFFSNRSTVAFSGLSEEVYRPITTVTFALNYFLGYVDSFGYHLVNVLFHAFNAMLLFLFLYMLLGNIQLALFAGLFFACHPVQTEVVSWISGRSSVLFLFFYLSTMIFYARFLKESNKVYYLYSVVFCALALFSKEMAVTLPLALVAYDVHFYGKGRLREKVYRYAPYFALTLFYLLARSAALGRVSQCGWWGGSPYYTFLTMLRVLAEYMKILIAPAKLCAFYAVNISRSLAEPPVIFSLALLALIAVSIPFIFKRSRAASFGVCLFFITLTPVLNIIPLKALMAERFLYLPSIGFCIILALLIEKIGTIRLKGIIDNGKILASLIAVSIIIAYAARTAARNEDWNNDMAITESIIAVSPMNPWAYNSLAAAYLAKGKNEEAIAPLMKSMALAKDYVAPRSALGFAYRELGRFDESIKILKEALAMKPDSLETINSLGVTYARMKRYEDAVKQFELSIKLDPVYVGAYLNLGATYERLSRYDKALKQYNTIARVTNSVQDVAVSYIRTGDLYRRMKQEDKAKQYYNKALGLCSRGLEELKKVVEDRLKGHLPAEK